MSKVVKGKDILLTELRLVSITFANELRGDPPVPTLMQITTYELLDNQGNVYELKSMGEQVTSRSALVNEWMKNDKVAYQLREGM